MKSFFDLRLSAQICGYFSWFSPHLSVSVVGFAFPITAIPRDYGDLGDS